MGRSMSEGLRDSVNEGICDLDTALSIHLSSNHYPPLPDCVLPLAKQAIQMANEGDWDGEVDLSEAGISWRGQSKAPVSACIEAWHLDCFLDEQE